MNRFLVLISVLVLISSCKKDEPVITEPKGWSYAGMNIGSVIEYEELYITAISDDVITDTSSGENKIVYVDGFDTVITYIKDSIPFKIEDLEGDSVFVLHRYYSSNRNYKETPDSVWTAKFENNLFIKTENNRKYSKLSFPIEKGKLWDVNIYNTDQYDDAEYTRIRFDAITNSINFNDVIEVEQNNNYDSSDLNSIFHYYNEGYSPYVDIKIMKEQYANSIGLISKTDIYLNNKDNSTDSLSLNLPYFWIDHLSSHIRTQKIIDYR